MTCKGSDWDTYHHGVSPEHVWWDEYVVGCRYMAASILIHYFILFYCSMRFKDWSSLKWNSLCVSCTNEAGEEKEATVEENRGSVVDGDYARLNESEPDAAVPRRQY